MPDTLSQEELETLRKRRAEEAKQAEAFDDNPMSDMVCDSCQ